MVHNHASTDTDKDKDKEGKDDTVILPTCYFYMPSGEQVSYCAHAAMGAAYILHTRRHWCCAQQARTQQSQSQSKEAQSTPPSSTGEILFQTAHGLQTKAFIHHGTDVVELGIPKQLQERTVDAKVVERLLDQIGLTMDCVDAHVDVDVGVHVHADVHADVHEDSDGNGDWNWPLVNSSVARYKTLIPIATLDQLHAACDPRDPLEFRDLCDSIDSTGVYLYSQVKMIDLHQHQHQYQHQYQYQYQYQQHTQQQQQQEYECRQFPRASGYPEDPATGIAASALACSLYQRGIGTGYTSSGEGEGEGGIYVMNQGTAMGKHSRCNVRVSVEEDMVFCAGTIAIDGEEYLDVEM